MATWTTERWLAAEPDEVLEALTDPDACTRWSPIDFELDDLEGARLQAGSWARVVGRLSGYRIGFDLEVLEASEERLALRALGPIELHVEYALAPADGGTCVSASVAARRRSGLLSLALVRATDALLAAGALHSALGRVAAELEREGELVA